MKNLIEIAAADGNFDQVEYDLLLKIAKRNGISASKLKAIKNDNSRIEFEVPIDQLEKFTQMYDLVHMMIIDNEIHSEEMKLCNLFAIKFGYQKSKVDELISTIKANIENKNSPKETMPRLKWLLE
ncbi:MAG TPA: hypothetical protein PKL31_11230 [Fulvivirga sp.]|nr:hypothetical protein [Fulvivirga sp.]